MDTSAAGRGYRRQRPGYSPAASTSSRAPPYGPPGTGKTHTFATCLSRLTGTTGRTSTAMRSPGREGCSIAPVPAAVPMVVIETRPHREERGMHPGQTDAVPAAQRDDGSPKTPTSSRTHHQRADLLDPRSPRGPVASTRPSNSCSRRRRPLARCTSPRSPRPGPDRHRRGIDRTRASPPRPQGAARRAAVVGAEGDGPRDWTANRLRSAVRAEHLSTALGRALATRNAMTRRCWAPDNPIPTRELPSHESGTHPAHY